MATFINNAKRMWEMKMDMSEKKSADNDQVYYYTCPMEEHKHIHSDKAGKCLECNMDLVAAVTTEDGNKEYYGCPMEAHSHVRHQEPGKCPECSMELKPMRLTKK